jgi:hypothetical protein
LTSPLIEQAISLEDRFYIRDSEYFSFRSRRRSSDGNGIVNIADLAFANLTRKI